MEMSVSESRGEWRVPLDMMKMRRGAEIVTFEDSDGGRERGESECSR